MQQDRYSSILASEIGVDGVVGCGVADRNGFAIAQHGTVTPEQLAFTTPLLQYSAIGGQMSVPIFCELIVVHSSSYHISPSVRIMTPTHTFDVATANGFNALTVTLRDTAEPHHEITE